MLVLSSPSGAGKTTLANRLLAAEPDMRMSVSVTTRPPRPGEVEGRDYYFVDEARFAQMRENGELLEWARVFDHHYGTPAAPVERLLTEGRDVLFDVDWQGARQLYMGRESDVIRVFILPPSGKTLAERLHRRGQDSESVVQRRMASAAAELSHWREYDYVIVNDDLDLALSQLRAILTAERLKRERQVGLETFVSRILADL